MRCINALIVAAFTQHIWVLLFTNVQRYDVSNAETSDREKQSTAAVISITGLQTMQW